MYVDHTLAVWPHAIDELHKFEQHPYNMHNSIKFTMETEMKGSPTFLDGTVTRQSDNQTAHYNFQ
jgi:hypothetical protein